MTGEEFLKYASQFELISNKICDGWLLKYFEDADGGSYLVKRQIETVDKLALDEESSNQLEEQEGEDGGRPASDEECNNYVGEVCTWEYHVLYSPSYAVPVLYFIVYNSGGRVLPLEQVWQLLRVPPQALASDKWQLVTQQEHPLLRRPFFQLHPCKTAQLLSNFTSSKVNTLVTWLSSVGPFVRLYLPLEYGQLADK